MANQQPFDTAPSAVLRWYSAPGAAQHRLGDLSLAEADMGGEPGRDGILGAGRSGRGDAEERGGKRRREDAR